MKWINKIMGTDSMETNIETMMVNGVEYVKKSSVQGAAVANKDGLPYVLIRSYGAGVFAGYLKKRKSVGDNLAVELLESKRIFQWYGAASLSQLAIDGTSDPGNCKIPAAIPEHEVMNVIEIIPISEKAKLSLEKVKVWKV